jgi:SAM-dependent methyltransferase
VQNYFVVREACPGCGSARCNTLYSTPYSQPPISDYLRSFYPLLGEDAFDYLTGADFTLDQCRDCSLIYQVEVPDDLLIHKLYEEWIEPGSIANDHFKGFGFTRQYLQEVMTFIHLLGKPPSELKVLDFGMGWGHWCMVVRAFGCQVWGYDLSQPQIEHARSLGIRVLDWDGIPLHHYDFIGCEQIFEHLVEPLKTLQFLSRCLNPQGIIKISVPNGNGIRRKLRNPNWKAAKYSKESLNPVSPLEHLNCFSTAAILAMARTVGLEPVRVPISVHYASLVNWKPWKPMLRNLLIPIYRRFHPRETYLLFRISIHGQE